MYSTFVGGDCLGHMTDIHQDGLCLVTTQEGSSGKAEVGWTLSEGLYRVLAVESTCCHYFILWLYCSLLRVITCIYHLLRNTFLDAVIKKKERKKIYNNT